MAWIESHQTLGQHPKTRRLARYLGISLPAAVGHLHYLWWWALNYAQNGDLSRYELEDIADAALWDGDAKDFVEALIRAGFLDQVNDKLNIHDWDDYAGRLLDQKQHAAEQKRRHRELYNNKTLIQAIRERDKDRCRYCGRSVNWKDRKGPDGATYDYVDPNGPTSLENIVVACRACNAGKGQRTPEEAGYVLFPPPTAPTGYLQKSTKNQVYIKSASTQTLPNHTLPNQDDYKIDSDYKQLESHLEPESETSQSSSVDCKDENQKVDISNPGGIEDTKVSEDGKESSAAEFQDSEDQEIDRYVEAVEERMRLRTGNPSYIVKRWDFKAAQDLMRRGIPLDFVLLGIDKAFEGFRPAHAEDRIETFSYCRKVILGLWGEELERKKLKADVTPALAGERTSRNRRSRADPEPVGRYIPDGPPEDPELDEFLKKAGFYDIPGIT